jgi:hypothetical protein
MQERCREPDPGIVLAQCHNLTWHDRCWGPDSVALFLRSVLNADARRGEARWAAYVIMYVFWTQELSVSDIKSGLRVSCC